MIDACQEGRKRFLRRVCVCSVALLAAIAVVLSVKSAAIRFRPADDDVRQSAATTNPLLASCMVRNISAQEGTAPDADQALREARAALAAGHLDEALRQCQEGVRLAPNSGLAYFLLGMIQMRRGAPGEARQAFLRSLNLEPAHNATHYYLGRLYLAAREFEAATSQFEAAIQLGDPSGMGHYGLGLTLLAQSHYTKAIPHLRAAVDQDTRDPERLFALIGAELQLKQFEQARGHLMQIRARFSWDPALAFRIGKALLEYNLPDEAEAEFELAAAWLANKSNNPLPPELNVAELYLQIARLRFDRQDYLGALQEFGNIAGLGVPASLQASAFHLEGQALVAVGKAPEAMNKLQKAVEANPSNPEYLVHLTWAQLLAQDARGAEATAQLANVKWPAVADVQLMQTLVKRERSAGRVSVPLSQEWHVKGEGMVCCPCKVPCPCRSNAAPTYKHCENTGAIRIQKGHYGKVLLDGFHFVAVNEAMETRTAPDTLYVEPFRQRRPAHRFGTDHAELQPIAAIHRD